MPVLNKNIPIILLGIIFFFVILFINGCATIVSGNKHIVIIQTDPSFAKVVIMNKSDIEIYNGITPCKFEIKRESLSYSNIRISKYGYETIDLKIGVMYEPTLYTNCCYGVFFPIGIGIDYLSGAWVRSNYDTFLFELKRDKKEAVEKTNSLK